MRRTLTLKSYSSRQEEKMRRTLTLKSYSRRQEEKNARTLRGNKSRETRGAPIRWLPEQRVRHHGQTFGRSVTTDSK